MFLKASTILPFACLLAFFMSGQCKAETYKHTISSGITADSVTGKYVDGKKHGIWRTFNSKGLLIKREKYKNGVLIYYTIYNENRKIIETRDRKGRVTHFKPCNC